MRVEKPRWLRIAEREIGVKVFAQGASNPRITEYHSATNIAGYDDKAAWCSSFVNWVFRKSQIDGTGSALARSWLEWGLAIREPVLGCVVVLEREAADSWQGHVGFFFRVENDSIFLLGGNQLDQVCEHSYPLSSVLGFRWPLSQNANSVVN